MLQYGSLAWIFGYMGKNSCTIFQIYPYKLLGQIKLKYTKYWLRGKVYNYWDYFFATQFYEKLFWIQNNQNQVSFIHNIAAHSIYWAKYWCLIAGYLRPTIFRTSIQTAIFELFNTPIYEKKIRAIICRQFFGVLILKHNGFVKIRIRF